MLRPVCRPVMRPVLGGVLGRTEQPSPAFDLNFMVGTLPAGLTYTNSSTTRTYFGSDGLLKTAAANEPIFEYNPVTLALLGMRWEMEQRTNLHLNSASWSAILPSTDATSVRSESTDVPPNSGVFTSSLKVTKDGTRSTFYAYSTSANSPVGNNVVNTRSFFFKPVENVASFGCGTSASDRFNFRYSLSTGVVTVGTNAQSARVDAIGGGWYRAQVTQKTLYADTGSTFNVVAIPVTDSADASFLVIGLQTEAAASASSYIPTAGSAVIRQPDELTASSISPWYNQSEGTVVFEGIATSAGDIERGAFIFHDGTNNNRIFSSINPVSGARFYVNNGGTQQASLNSAAGTVVRDAVFRHAAAYKQDYFASAINGSVPATDASGLVASGITTLRFGSVTTSGSTSAFMGYARRFSYYNTRLPNSQIQGLSCV